MGDKAAENLNIEQDIVGSAEGKINSYEDTLKGKEIGKAETEQDRKKAEEILNQIQGASSEEAKKKIVQENFSTLPPEVKTAINQLNRPDAQGGIEQSYTEIDTTIKNSKNEKGIAGFLGKIMNKILGQ